MNVKDLLREDDAVSPVIGVILMVAITVILAAVIGTFVLGLGDQVQSSAPNANFQFEYGTVSVNDDDATADTLADINEITVTHNGGQDVEAENVRLEVGGDLAYGVTDTDGDGEYEEATVPFASGTLSTGSSATVVFVDTDGPGSTNDYAASPTAISSTSSGFDSDAGVIDGGETVRVIWESPSGDSSNTIGESTVPN